MSELSEAIRSMVEEKGISQDLVLDTIRQTLLATYRRKLLRYWVGVGCRTWSASSSTRDIC